MKIAEEHGPKEITTIEQRNEVSQQIMSIANIPSFNWTIDPENGDITVMSEVQPVRKGIIGSTLDKTLWTQIQLVYAD